MGAAGLWLDAPTEPTTLDPLPAPRVASSPTTVQCLHVCGYHTEGAQCGHTMAAGSGFMSCSVLAYGWHRDTPPGYMGLHNPTVTCPDSLFLTSIHQLRNKVSEEHEVIKKKELETGPKASYGYGGKFGTERDRMDKVTVVEGFLGPQWKSLFLMKERASQFSDLTLKGENGELADSNMSS